MLFTVFKRFILLILHLCSQTKTCLHHTYWILSNYNLVFIRKMRNFKNIVFFRLVLNRSDFIWSYRLNGLFWIFGIILWVIILIRNIFDINKCIIVKLIDFTLIESSHKRRFILWTNISALKLWAALTMYIKFSRVTLHTRLNLRLYMRDI